MLPPAGARRQRPVPSHFNGGLRGSAEGRAVRLSTAPAARSDGFPTQQTDIPGLSTRSTSLWNRDVLWIRSLARVLVGEPRAPSIKSERMLRRDTR